MQTTKRWVLIMVLVVGMGARLTATHINQVQEAFDTAKSFSYEQVYNNKAFTDLSSAIVYEASLSIELFDGTLAMEEKALFVPHGQALASFRNASEFLSSQLFLSTLDAEFSLLTDEDARRFLSFLYLIDGEYFHDGCYHTEHTWYFIRDEFFGDIEMWVVNTDEKGHIQSIVYAYEEDAELPDQLLGAFTQEEYDDHEQEAMPSESDLKNMHRILEESLRYDLCVQGFDDSILSQLWEGTWYSLDVASEIQDEDGYSYTSTSVFYAYFLDQEVSLFGSLWGALEHPCITDSMHASFCLDSEQQAILFEQAIEVLERNANPMQDRFQRGSEWYFIKDEWFGDGEGFIVTVDDANRMVAIRYEYSIPLGADEIPDTQVFAEEVFDSSLVDWTLALLEPESTDFPLIEGQGVSVAIEFDAYAATQAGAWMLTLLNGEMFGMNYSSEGLDSPYYDWIEPDVLPVGTHTISYLLMKPGMDVEDPLGRIDLEVEIIAFDAPEGIWDLRMLEPLTQEVHIKKGSSGTIRVAFDDSATKKYGVNLAIRYRDEIVGGQNSMHLESPFETVVPANILNEGEHRVDILLVRPGSSLLPPLAECSVTFHVQ